MIKKILFIATTIALASLSAQAQEVVYECNFETNEQLVGMQIADMDGDGDNWEVWNGASEISHTGEGVAMSYSYVNSDGPRDPDNWLILPPVTLGQNAKLHFYVRGLDANWAMEHYGVFIAETAEGATFDPEDYTSIYDAFSSAEYGDGIELDLAEYEGKTVSIAFRHYNITIPMFALLLDDITITDDVISGINDVKALNDDGAWYDLQGHRYGERPTTAGLYIHNGKKIIIK